MEQLKTGEYVVGTHGDIEEGTTQIVEVDGRSIGVSYANGKYYALRNRCPHQSAPLCQGPISGVMESSGPGEYKYTEDKLVMVCPWHHWEFELETGQFVLDSKMRVRTYQISVENNLILLRLSRDGSVADD